jgi:signal transduction histidine kinase
VPKSYLDAVAALGLLDTPPEAVFDRLTAVVVRALKVPVSTFTLIDERRQFFKAACGLPDHLAQERETPLSHSFCKHVVLENTPLIVEDSRVDEKVRDNPAVQTLGVIAYAGIPVRDGEGTPIGSLCAISHVPRAWTPDELETLTLLAEQASGEIAVRATALRLGLNLAEMQAAEEQRHQMVRLDRHDLRTPLNAMLLSITGVGFFGPVNDDQKECIAAAKRNCDAVLSILDRMLDIGNIDHQGAGALTISQCHPTDLLARALEQVASLAERRHIHLEIDDAVVLPAVDADEGKIIRVLVNLLGNAVKFSAPDAHITASAKPGNAEANNGAPTSIIFSVKDNGIGIPLEDQNRIFIEGVHLNQDTSLRRSSGLGLTFCKRVVEIHNGRIWLESTPGKGSTFSFSLPVNGSAGK